MKKKIQFILGLLVIVLSFILIKTVSNNIYKNKTEINYEISEKVEFTDSLNRVVTVPKSINRVAISGPLTLIPIFSLAPEKLIGIPSTWDDFSKSHIDEKYKNLPALGQLYGGKGTLNTETIISLNPDVIIDVGEQKDNMKEDLDKIQEQTGIPFVHINADLHNLDKTYEKLGKLLNKEKEAKILSDYCKKTYERANEILKKVDKKTLIYCTGKDGLNVIAKNSYFAQVLDRLADNIAIFDNPSSKGSGNEIDYEKLLKLNPDILFYSSDEIYNKVKDNEILKELNAIKNNNYYLVPNKPYNILTSPPSVQRILGLTWGIYILYKDYCNFNINDEFKTFYNLFYHMNISDEDLKYILNQ